MNLVWVMLLAASVLLIAYQTYGWLLSHLLQIGDEPTPAHTLRDDIDYIPTEKKFLLSQHFSAIAAAGPIVGPILAGVAFGWLPALIWILVGSIFIGGVHDFASLVASVRHRARSIAEIVNQYMSRRSYLLFLAFIWVALVYIIAAFTDIVAASFVGQQPLEDGSRITGGGVASSSLMYLLLPIVMGLLLRFTKLSIGWATVIFVPLVGVAIWAGQKVPFDLAALLGVSDATAIKIWDILLLVYCWIAGILPVWLLLQPRGYLGGYFLYFAIGGSVAGMVLGVFQGAEQTITYPAFVGWNSGIGNLMPMLFITIACGACSGFHCLIASGTTSKQLRTERDAKPIGYGAMLIEAMVAIVSLGCVMLLVDNDAAIKNGPNYIYALGLGKFLSTFGIPAAWAVSFGLLAFTTFVYDTLDVCPRLGRYIFQEFTGWKSTAGAWVASGVTAAIPLFFISLKVLDAQGNPIPAWRLFWSLFGASNQLLAALALVGLTLWLWSTRRAWWAWLVAGVPAVWMFTVSTWALGTFVKQGFFGATGFQLPANPVPWAAVVLLALAALVLVEAVRSVARPLAPSHPDPEPQVA